MISALTHLKHTIERYYPISPSGWSSYKQCLTSRQVKKGEILYAQGEVPTHFAFIHKGLMRAYITDVEGNEFNKNFFSEGRFPGAMTALIKSEASFLAIEALEGCEVIEIDFSKFRKALFEIPELMKFHIHYLEEHWLLEKETKEIGYLQFEAKQRYLKFLENYQVTLPRIAQYHIASYLGITPTQLSRIKKDLKSKASQHM